MEKGHNPLSIANYFISTSGGMHLLKLVKLCYISHGYCLALLDKPLVNETVEAWKYGPVFPTIYDRFKGNGFIIETAKVKEEQFNESEKEIMQAVYENYSGLSGVELSTLTHSKGTPWYIAWHEEGGKKYLNYPIKNEKIKRYYKNLRHENSSARK